jgi:prevent-host-death family protein
MVMQEISISEFKAKCLAILQQVSKTKKPIRVTRYGKPIAEVVPASPAKDRTNWLGCMKGSGKIVGDIVSPVIDLEEWEALRD